jgi:hypothetical protein
VQSGEGALIFEYVWDYGQAEEFVGRLIVGRDQYLIRQRPDMLQDHLDQGLAAEPQEGFVEAHSAALPSG